MAPGIGAVGQYAVADVGGTRRKSTFEQFSEPVRKVGLTAAVIATTFVGFVAPPQAQAAPVFSVFSQPTIARNAALNASWLSTPFFQAQFASVFTPFSQPLPNRQYLFDEQPSYLFEVLPPPPPPFTGFTPFSLPLAKPNLTDEQPSYLFEVLPPAPPPFVGFSPFSIPLFRPNLTDEQPSYLFEVLPPQPVPFTGFARFDYRLTRNPLVSVDFRQFVFIPQPDRHDGVFVKKRHKRKQVDLLDYEIKRKERLRQDIYDAIYGPNLEYLWKPEKVEVKLPPNTQDLADVILATHRANLLKQQAELEQSDEDDIEFLLGEIE